MVCEGLDGACAFHSENETTTEQLYIIYLVRTKGGMAKSAVGFAHRPNRRRQRFPALWGLGEGLFQPGTRARRPDEFHRGF